MKKREFGDAIMDSIEDFFDGFLFALTFSIHLIGGLFGISVVAGALIGLFFVARWIV